MALAFMGLGSQGKSTAYREVREYQGKPLSSIEDFRENSIKGPQNVNISDYSLLVHGLVNIPKIYRYEEILGMPEIPKKVITIFCVEGWSATFLWKGIPVYSPIDSSDPLPNANIVVFHAVDKYTTSIPLAYIRKKEIILGYKMNDATLPKNGVSPFNL